MIKFNHNNGFVTMAKDPAIGLTYWLHAQHPIRPIPIGAKPFDMFTGQPVTYPTEGPEFLKLVEAACERTFNKTFLQSDDVSQITDYQKVCAYILNWLRQHGNISHLTCDPEEAKEWGLTSD